jgi:hypothetical protein
VDFNEQRLAYLCGFSAYLRPTESDYESEGRRFESCRARPSFSCKSSVFALDISLRAGLYHLFD